MSVPARRSVLAVKVGDHVRGEWLSRLTALLPDVDVIAWDQSDTQPVVDFAAVWRPEHGRLATLPGLRGIVSIAAGVDHLLEDPALPRHIPIVRTTGELLVTRMVEYVTLHTLRHHRDLDRALRARDAARWKPYSQPPASQCQVGIMGLGSLGTACARALQAVGFNVAAWTRSPRTSTGATRVFSGDAALDSFLRETRILICLLPLTDSTRDILSRRVFEKLPEGAFLINVARGEHLVETDLLAALDSGQLAGATLDVFRTEPLPDTHVFWSHPDILVTPHIAALIDAKTGSRLVAGHIRRFMNDETPVDLIDPDTGY